MSADNDKYGSRLIDDESRGLLERGKRIAHRLSGHLQKKDPFHGGILVGPIPTDENAIRHFNAEIDAAQTYVDEFYERLRDVVDLTYDIQYVAIDNFKDYSDVPNPPDRAVFWVLSAIELAFGALLGWTAVASGITGGIFAQKGSEWLALVKSGGASAITRDVKKLELLSKIGEVQIAKVQGAIGQTFGELIDVVKGTVGVQETAPGVTAALAASSRGEIVALKSWARNTITNQQFQMTRRLDEWKKSLRAPPNILNTIKDIMGPVPQMPRRREELKAQWRLELDLYRRRYGRYSEVYYMKKTLVGLPIDTGWFYELPRAVLIRIRELFQKLEGKSDDETIRRYLDARVQVIDVFNLISGRVALETIGYQVFRGFL